jgi:hypothetical protein
MRTLQAKFFIRRAYSGCRARPRRLYEASSRRANPFLQNGDAISETRHSGGLRKTPAVFLNHHIQSSRLRPAPDIAAADRRAPTAFRFLFEKTERHTGGAVCVVDHSSATRLENPADF